MPSLDKIKQAVKILEYAEVTDTWPAMTADPEVNYFVDLLVENEWEDIDPEEQAMYIEEAKQI